MRKSRVSEERIVAVPKEAHALLDGVPVSAMKDRMWALERRLEALEAAVASRDTPPPSLHPNMATLYLERVTDLARISHE
jgi:site-specific DNA recombinase